MKIILGPVNCGRNGIAHTTNKMIFESEKEKKLFFNKLNKSGIKYTVTHTKNDDDTFPYDLSQKTAASGR